MSRRGSRQPSDGSSNSAFDSLKDGRLTAFRRRLNAWFGKFGRVLPWRETSDPYRVWVSEIMLQQTTVKAVIPYYERFLERFPNVQSLAAASEAEVLRHWEGLGYYSRGRNLHRAAQAICDQFGRRIPETLTALQQIPGIGRYTAGAIRTFAFDLPAPIVEANTLRFYCRLLGYDGDPTSSSGQKLLWSFAEHLQPSRSAGRFNQALMELGATVCMPRNPSCQECPVREFCRAFAENRQNEIPRKKGRPEITELVEATCAIQHRGRYLLRQRSPEERWGGLWDFPRFPVVSIPYSGPLSPRHIQQLQTEVTSSISQTLGLSISNIRQRHDLSHSVTRYRIRLLCLSAEAADAGALWETEGQLIWCPRKQLDQYPMPVTGRKFASLLQVIPKPSEPG